MIERTEGLLTVADGESIWFETAGTGPALVMAHGLGGNAAVWFNQLPDLARRFRVVTWDQRGFGRSTNRLNRHGPASAVSDQVALMDHLEIEQAHLLGQSMGGWAALGTALSAPSRARSVVLACTTGGAPVRLPDPPTSQAADSSVRPLGVHPALGDAMAKSNPAIAYLYQALGTFGSRPPDSEFMRILGETSYSQADLAEVSVPVLMLCGELDGLMRPDIIGRAASMIPTATVIEMADYGHSPYIEAPSEWNRIVNNFLDSVESPA